MLEQRTLKFRIIYTSALIVLSIASFWYFGTGVVEITKQLKSLGESVEFDKITFLSLGFSFAMLGFLIQAYFEHVQKVYTPKFYLSIIGYLWVAGAFLMIALPIIGKYGVQYYIYGKGYSYCREAEYEGNVRQVSLFYTRDRESCIRVALKESPSFRRDAIEYLEEKKKKGLQ
ncbi:MAG: hypothetical protein CMD81_10675 [Gammaproteobacteria bacterium]|nr:hypothetical protein [Gammaproteobacteria bacterium]|tara:strand:+ start:6954 stop:7472 length:519 start_codon:yes stop_codon:yes gene_type:complete